MMSEDQVRSTKDLGMLGGRFKVRGTGHALKLDVMGECGRNADGQA